MDASNLGIVLAPSLMKPPQINTLAVPQNNNPLKSQAGEICVHSVSSPDFSGIIKIVNYYRCSNWWPNC